MSDEEISPLRVAAVFGVVAGIVADIGGLVSLAMSTAQMAIANPGEATSLVSASVLAGWLV